MSLILQSGRIVGKGGGIINAGVTALSDWTTRSTGPGVVWAQAFQSLTDVSKYIVHGGTPLSSIIPTYTNYNAGGSRLGAGYGSLIKNTPANDANAGKGSFCKPFNPISGVDINNAGVTTISNFTQIQDDGVWGNTNLGGYFAKTATVNTIGNEFWLQAAVKFSANRFDSGVPYGKFFFLTMNNASTPDQEIVADAVNGFSWGGRYCWFYTNGGNAWNSQLGNPQDSGAGSTGDSYQPGSAFAATCIVGNNLGPPVISTNCYLYPVGAWFTIMFHVKAGSQANTTNSPTGGQNSWTANPTNLNDTTFEVFIAPSGQTTWDTVFSSTGQQFQFQSQDTAGTLGWNIMEFLDFTGGPSEVTSPVPFSHEGDQMILSKQAIPCPQA